MKQVLSLLILLSLQSYTPAETDISGIWESKGASGNVLGLNLKKDGSFVSYLNKKLFTTGNYTFLNGIITVLEDNGCKDSTDNSIPGVYELVFFVPDSFRIDVKSDRCVPRKKGVQGSRYGRVTKK